MNEKKAMQAARRRSLTFTLVRGAAAIGIALLVAAVLIFVSADGETALHNEQEANAVAERMRRAAFTVQSVRKG